MVKIICVKEGKWLSCWTGVVKVVRLNPSTATARSSFKVLNLKLLRGIDKINVS